MDTRKTTFPIIDSRICDPQDSCGYRDCDECQRLLRFLQAARQQHWAPLVATDAFHAESDEVMSAFMRE